MRCYVSGCIARILSSRCQMSRGNAVIITRQFRGVGDARRARNTENLPLSIGAWVLCAVLDLPVGALWSMHGVQPRSLNTIGKQKQGRNGTRAVSASQDRMAPVAAAANWFLDLDCHQRRTHPPGIVGIPLSWLSHVTKSKPWSERRATIAFPRCPSATLPNGNLQSYLSASSGKVSSVPRQLDLMQ